MAMPKGVKNCFRCRTRPDQLIGEGGQPGKVTLARAPVDNDGLAVDITQIGLGRSGKQLRNLWTMISRRSEGGEDFMLGQARSAYHSLAIVLWLLSECCGGSTALAHNASVHRDMTERAWEIMIALSGNQLDMPANPDTVALAAAAGSAIRNLQGLPAALPPPKQTRCADLDLIRRYGSSPNWGAPADFTQLTLGAVPYPVSVTYITGNDCGIDPDWKPGAFFDSINGGHEGSGRQDLTGVVLGFWAHQPDDEEDDWHIFFRPTNAGGMSFVKNYIETTLGAGAATVWVPLHCLLACAGDFLGLGGSCKDCLDQAIDDAKHVIHEGVEAVDGLAPGFGDHTSLFLYTGMGHHIDVAPPGAPAPWKLNPAAYDDRPGLLLENAGPIGIPDSVEFLAMTAADGFGMTVHYDPSRGPKRYEIRNRQDAHPDSVHRGEADWQFQSFAHTPFTPLDNLARAGWDDFRADPRAHVRDLGWPLHAFGDAIVPMHVAGTSGWGHRPYEDAFEQHFAAYLHTEDANAARLQAIDIVQRAVVWRKIIVDWRRLHPESGSDIPIRDLITRLAQFTWSRISGPAMLVWPFNPAMSTQYLVPVTGKGLAIGYYELAPGADAVNRDLATEAIAAEMAFLISAAEVLP